MSRMISPPSSHRLSRCRLRVFRDKPCASRSSRNGVNTATICSPGITSRSSPHQLAAQVAKSGQKVARSGVPAMMGGSCFCVFAMRLISILNHCYHFPGFVNVVARLCEHTKSIEVEVRPRVGSKAICSICRHPAPTYDHLGVRRFEFVHLLGLLRFPTVSHAPGGLSPVWREGRGGAVGLRQAPDDNGLCPVPGALGQEAILEGDGPVVSNIVGQGLSGG